MPASKLISFRPLNLRGSTRRMVRLLHRLGQLILPILVLLLVRADIVALAVVLVILSKWRTLAVRPRFWLANIRSSSIDVIVGISAVIFIVHAPNLAWEIIWTVLYAGWLTAMKPSSRTWIVSLQALVGEAAGLVSLLIAFGGSSLLILTITTGIICYLAARHFFDAFEEAYSKLLSYLWGTFGAAVMWILGNLLFFYGPISQPAVLLSAVSVGIGTLYYLDHFDKNSVLARRQIALMILVVIGIILAKIVPLMFYIWSDNVL